jgi:hypothetical protein
MRGKRNVLWDTLSIIAGGQLALWGGACKVPRLRTLVRTHDPSAFVVVADAAEVLGEGFHRET